MEHADVQTEEDVDQKEDSTEEQTRTNDEKILEFQTILERLIAQELKVTEVKMKKGAARWILQYADSRWQGKKQQLHARQKSGKA